MRTSSRRSPSGRWEISCRSRASSRWNSSRWALMDTYSPAAMEKAPPTSPASPARRTTPAWGWAPAMPRMRETLVTRPSLIPNTAARAPPPDRLRWWWSRACISATGRWRPRTRAGTPPAASDADCSMGFDPNGGHIQRDGNCHNGPMAGARRFLDPSQPQTLQGAVMLCYITAVFGLLTLFALGLLSLLPLGLAFGAYGIANEKRWGYWLAVVLAALN